MADDLIVIGAGPAGLSAALNGAAEGLATRVLEAGSRTGGQAGTSSLIENYPGYVDGASGADIARDFTRQALRLGAKLETDSRVDSLAPDGTGWRVRTHDARQYHGRAIILAAGVDYRRLEAPGAAETDRIKYGATPEVHAHYAGEPVAVIGAANSAAQAALNLARNGARVTILARRTLEDGASAYLVARIRSHPRVSVRERVTVARVFDTGGAAALELSDGSTLSVAAAFAYIGAEPRAGFAAGACQLDSRGFVEALAGTLESPTAPGVFVAGDLRSGSRKRVAAAVGEGAIAAARAWSHVHGEVAR